MELGAQKNQKQNKNEKKRVLHAVKWEKKSSKCTKMKILINQIFENGMVFRRQLHNTKWIIWKTIFLLYVIYRPNAKHVLLFFHYYSVLLLCRWFLLNTSTIVNECFGFAPWFAYIRWCDAALLFSLFLYLLLCICASISIVFTQTR